MIREAESSLEDACFFKKMGNNEKSSIVILLDFNVYRDYMCRVLTVHLGNLDLIRSDHYQLYARFSLFPVLGRLFSRDGRVTIGI
jgi:hypothetical protein